MLDETSAGVIKQTQPLSSGSLEFKEPGERMDGINIK